MPRTPAPPDRVPLRAVLKALGIGRTSFYQHWRDTFTPHHTDGGYLRFSMDEVTEALAHTDPAKARAAVLMLRRKLGRLTTHEPR